MEQPLEGLRVAILASDMVEESELKDPRAALEDAGATTELIAPVQPTITAARHFDKGDILEVDRLLSEVEPGDYDALLLPGGALNADLLRVNEDAQRFVQHFDSDGKPMAIICHAPWLLVSAGLAKGRTLTSFHTIADDITNAGGHWLDEAVVRDDNWVTSRQPDDIPLFNEAMISLFTPAEGAASRQTTEAELAFRERLNEDQDT